MTIQDWDTIFKRQGWGHWPDTRFVEWCMRTFGNAEDRSKVRFLELGCGFGAQLKFLWAEGFHAEGIDGSQTAVDYVHALPDRRGIVVQADLTGFPEADADGYRYDCILDVCTLQHIPPGANAQLIYKARGWLKPGGWIFSKWAQHPPDGRYVRRDPSMPEVHLMAAPSIRHVFPGFELRTFEEVVTDANGERRHWIITGRKA